MQDKLALSGRMYSGKPCGSSTRGLLSQESSQTTRSSWHTSTLDCIVDSVLPSLGNLLVVMVQPSQDRNSNHPASFVRSVSRCSRGFGDLLLDPLMRSCLIEVHHIRFEDTLELSLMKDQQVVQAFLPHTPQEALTDRIGSGSMIRRFEDLNAARCCHSGEMGSKPAIIIANEVPGRLPIGSSFPQLLRGPHIGGRARHPDMDDFPRSQFNDEEGKKRAKKHVSNLEEIAGPDLSRMIAQKRPPALPRCARRTYAPHVFLDRSFADTDIQFQ